MRRLPQLDPDVADPQPVHCFGCGRLLGIRAVLKEEYRSESHRERPAEVFCEKLCWYKQQLPSLENASRDRAIRYLVEIQGITMTAVGEIFGLHRIYVGEIVAQGNDVDYLQSGRKQPVSDEVRAKRVRAGQLGAAKTHG